MYRTRASEAPSRTMERALPAEQTREDNARCATQALSRLFRDSRCGGFYPIEEIGASEIPDEPAFDVGRHYTWRSRRLG